ncbi:MAG: TetR/AcrR family transcriptional regulator [Clostridiaceae bacterium]
MEKNDEKLSQSEKILQAAYECISVRGYSNVSLRDIADEAGVVLSQLNYYYNNKEGLFIEVIKMMMSKYIQEIEYHLERGTTAKEKISSLIKYFEELVDKNPKLFRLLYDLTSMALWSASVGRLLSELFEEIAQLIEKHVINLVPENSNFKKYSSGAIARMLFGAMFGTFIQVLLDPHEKQLRESLNTIELMFS